MIKPNRHINYEMISLARESRGLSQTELAERVGISQGEISKIEQGLHLVKEDLLTKLAHALEFNLSLFYEDERFIAPNVIYYRKRKSLPKKDLAFVDANLAIRKIHIKKLLKSVNLPDKLEFYSTSEYGGPEDIARIVRQFWEIPKGPIFNLMNYVEDAGILVLELDTEIPKLDGMVISNGRERPFIYLNSTSTGDRQRFNLAHELGHLIMHISVIPKADIDIEKEANRFAAELLLPEEEFTVSATGRWIDLAFLAELKMYWKVSMQAIIERLKTLEIIDEKRHKSLYVQISRAGYRKNEPPCGVYRETPSLVKELIDTYINDLGYTIEDLANLFHLSIPEFQRIYMRDPSRFKVIR